jgi:hypothetical protein
MVGYAGDPFGAYSRLLASPLLGISFSITPVGTLKLFWPAKDSGGVCR